MKIVGLLVMAEKKDDECALGNDRIEITSENVKDEYEIFISLESSSAAKLQNPRGKRKSKERKETLPSKRLLLHPQRLRGKSPTKSDTNPSFTSNWPRRILV